MSVALLERSIDIIYRLYIFFIQGLYDVEARHRDWMEFDIDFVESEIEYFDAFDDDESSDEW